MAYLSTVASSAFDFQNFFSAKLTSSLTASDTDIPMDTIPSISEGVLVIDWDVAASREVIFFNSKTATKVVCPSAANGRGFDGSTATTHASGANVIMAPVADYFRYIKYIATTSTAAWKALGYTPNTITDNGNHSYTLVFNSVDLTSFLSPGMKVKGTPTTAQPTQCTSLNGTTQYYSRSSAGLGSTTVFTDDWAAGAWIKLAALPSADAAIISRYNGTSGWIFYVDTAGRLNLKGYNGGGANYRGIQSYSYLPLNKWVHVAAQNDMSTYTATTTTSYVMIDGVDVSTVLTQGGTNPTALIQAGNLEIGTFNGGLQPLSAKLAQVFYTNAKLTQANVRLIKNQGITAANCTTYNIVSAYSFNNSITDINTGSANDLTANGSAVATNADSPFGLDANGTPGTTEWGEIATISFSTNTTVVIQSTEGSAWPTLPTSSMISSMSYSTEATPYGMPSTRPYVRTVLNHTAGTITNTSINLANTGLIQTLTTKGNAYAKIRIDIGIGATSDFEFGIHFRVNGTVQSAYSFQPNAASGTAGGRAVTRGSTAVIPLTDGDNIISAGVNIANGGGYALGVGGASMTVEIARGYGTGN